MSFTIITDSDTVKGPHQTKQLIEIETDLNEAEIGMVMIHGRGASAQSILSLAEEFEAKDSMTFVAPQAQGHTWYPYSFLAPVQNNQPGLDSGLQATYDAIHHLEKHGIPKENIFLLGFSQGACLVSEFAARHTGKYAGIIALSGGLIGETVDISSYSGDLQNTPYFVGCSDVDAHIPEERVHQSAKVFEKLNARVDKRMYPNMGHTINQDELSAINELMKTKLDSL